MPPKFKKVYQNGKHDLTSFFEKKIGLVLNMVWDPSGERLVVSFKDSNFMALFCTKVTSTRLSITPLGFIQGEPDEFSSTMEFAQKFSGKIF